MQGTMLQNRGLNRTNAYLAKEIMDASPQKLLIKVLDFALVHCKRGDMVKTNNALSELINALNFEIPEAKEIATGLLKLYQFCQEQMRQGNTEIVADVLSNLREAWITTFNKQASKE